MATKLLLGPNGAAVYFATTLWVALGAPITSTPAPHRLTHIIPLFARRAAGVCGQDYLCLFEPSEETHLYKFLVGKADALDLAKLIGGEVANGWQVDRTLPTSPAQDAQGLVYHHTLIVFRKEATHV